MDFSKIAGDSLNIILPYLKSIIDGTLKSAGADLWKLIKKPFKLDHDKKLVDKLEKDPDNLKLQGGLELRLAQLLEENPDIAEELEKCIRNFKEKEGMSNIYIQKDNTYNGPVHNGKGDMHTTYYNINNNAEKKPKKN